MEKYRIKEYNKNSKELILESSTGKLVSVNEGVFKDTYIKVKNAAISLIHKGKTILTKIGDRIVDLVTPVQTMANDRKGVYIKLSGEMEELARDNGIEVKDTLDDKLQSDEEEDVSDESMAKLCALFITRLLKSVKIGGEHVSEAATAQPYMDDEVPSVLDPESSPIYKERSYGDRPGRKIGGDKSNETYVRIQPLRSWITGVPDVNRAELVDDLETQIEAIFSIETTGTSAVDFNRSMYKPKLIFGAPGIGKTTLIKQIIKKYSGSDLVKGNKVSFINLSGGSLSSYSIASPLVSDDLVVKHDEYNNPIKNADDNGFETTKGSVNKKMGTGISANIPAFKYVEYIDNDTENSRNVEQYNIQMDDALGYGIIFIDEYGRMKDPDLIDSINQMVQSREIGGWCLGTHWVIVAASNYPLFDLSSDYGSQHDLWQNADPTSAKEILGTLFKDSAAVDRFNYVNFLPTYDEWIGWARKRGLNRLIIDFLSSPLYAFQWYNTWDVIPYNNGNKISQPRDWEDISWWFDQIDKKFKIDSYINTTEVKEYIAAIINSMKKNSLPFVAGDMENFLTDELTNLSRGDMKNIWGDPAKITYTPKSLSGASARLKNIEHLPSMRPYAGNPITLAERVYSEKDFSITKGNVDQFIYNELGKKLDNVALFIYNFFGSEASQKRSLKNDIDGKVYQIPAFDKGQSRALDFAAELCRLIVEDIKKAYPSGKQINTSLVFGNIKNKFPYEDQSNLNGSEYRSFLFSQIYRELCDNKHII